MDKMTVVYFLQTGFLSSDVQNEPWGPTSPVFSEYRNSLHEGKYGRNSKLNRPLHLVQGYECVESY